MSFPDPFRRARRVAKVKYAPRRLLFRCFPRLLARAQRRHLAQVEQAIADGAEEDFSINPPKLGWITKAHGRYYDVREEPEPED